MKTILQQLFAILLVAALAPCLVAQENDPNLEKLAGTWNLDVEKTAESIDDPNEVEMMRQMADQMKIQMIFRVDGTLDMMQGDRKMPGNPTFELAAKEGEKDTFVIEITREDEDEPMRGTIKFADKNTIHVTPDDESTIVMVREMEAEKADDAEKGGDAEKADDAKMVVELENAGEFFAGRWNANAEATIKMLEEDDDHMLPEGGDVPNVFVEFDEDGGAKLGEGDRDPIGAEFSIESGENDNEFIIIVTPEGSPRDIELKATVIDKNRVKMQPEGEIPIILERAK